MADITPPVRLSDILTRLVTIEGRSCFHGAQYFASSADLELAQYRTAKRLLRASEPVREQYLAKLKMFRDSGGSMGCCFCNSSFRSLAESEIIGDRLIHTGCLVQWEAFLSSRVAITTAGREALESDCGIDWEIEAEAALALLYGAES